MSTGCKLTVIELRAESSIQGFEGPAQNISWELHCPRRWRAGKSSTNGIVRRQAGALWRWPSAGESRGRHSRLKHSIGIDIQSKVVETV